MREGVSLFLRFKVDAQHCFRFVEPVTERRRCCILRVQPPAHPSQKIPQLFAREPNFNDVKHGFMIYAESSVSRGQLLPNAIECKVKKARGRYAPRIGTAPSSAGTSHAASPSGATPEALPCVAIEGNGRARQSRGRADGLIVRA